MNRHISIDPLKGLVDIQITDALARIWRREADSMSMHIFDPLDQLLAEGAERSAKEDGFFVERRPGSLFISREPPPAVDRGD